MRLNALTAGAIALLFLAMWVVVPAPVRVLFPLAVAMPELSSWLALIAMAVGVTALRKGRRLPAAAAGLAWILAVIPLAQVPGTVLEIDQRLESALGYDYLDRVPLFVRGDLPTSALSVRELLFGLWPQAGRPVHDVQYTVAGSTPLHAEIYPTPFPDAPLIVQVHGGSWQRGASTDDASIARYLASHGYLVVALDYRRAPAVRWREILSDVREGIAWAKSHAAEYGGDARRTALLGRSAGGHLALMAAYAPDGPVVDAVVSFYGPTDLTLGYEDPPHPDPIGIRNILESLIGGTPGDRPGDYRDASPMTYASRPVPPTLLVTGERDHVVLARFSAELDQKLRAAGNRSVLIELPWAEHAFDAIPFGPGGQLGVYATERFLAWALRR